MSLNRDNFINDYLDELDENIYTIDTSIIALKKNPEAEEELVKLMRALHTIKGSSSMLGFDNMEKVAHGLENVFKGVKEKHYSMSKELIQLVFITTGYLKEGIKKIKDEKNDNISIDRLLAVYEKACRNEAYDIGFFRKVKELDKEEEALPEAEQQERGEGSEQSYNSIRIKLKKVDDIIKLFNTLIIHQFQLKKEKDSLSELEKRIYAFMGLFNTIFISNREKNVELKKQLADILKLLQQSKKRFFENLALVENAGGDVQEEILSLRMLPLKIVLDPLHKMVEELALELGKEIELTIRGGEVTLDKLILEKISDPLLHLIRNAIDHGLELPEERERKGKARKGKIEIACYAESGNIFIRIKDDGQGLNYDRIRRRACEFFPKQAAEIEVMANELLHRYLFMPGFSTRQEATTISGRGIGLDIVGHNIEIIKGKITLTSKQDEGTEFLLSLPLSLATIEGFFVMAGDEKFLLPANYVTELLLIKKEDILELQNKQVIKVREKIIPLYSLAGILDKPAQEETELRPKSRLEARQKKLSVIIVNSLGEVVGFVVDSIIQYSSLICKPVPKNLAGLRAIQGVVYDENFNIVTILYVPEILDRLRQIPAQSLKPLQETENGSKSILVVDDSYFTRETVKSILELENYRVMLAVDGEDGLAKLKKQACQLIITDINMPRMDGLQFVEELKKEEAYRQIPIIVISSLLEDHQLKNRFLTLGANTFILKSEFDRTNLLNEVKNLL